jgi:bacterioferritin (cytochrome b1)
MIAFKSDADKKFVLTCLQENMNEEYRATMQYVCHRISARGQDDVMADSFKSAALDEMAHILFFSDLITKHGAVPCFTDWEIDKSTDLKSMLEADIRLEQAARARYAQQIARLEAYPELVGLLKSVLSDEEDHENEFSAYLKKLG